MMEGRRLADRFLILKTIDASGATELCLAQDEQLGELIALRVLTASFAGRPEILRDACRDTRRLAHPNIARVFDFHGGEATPFLCREYIEGASIAEFAGRSIAERLEMFAQVASAVGSAHALGVIHGDLKASKILRDVRGSIRVLDFQIAAAHRATASSAASGDTLSPQVRRGEGPVAADDVYSLGILIAQAIPTAAAPRGLSELIGAMSAEPRSARPTDLGKIAQTLTALSSGDVRQPDAVLSAPPPQPAAVSAVPRDVVSSARARSGSSRNRQYAIGAAALALAAGVVFVVLPRWVESSGGPGSRPHDQPSSKPIEGASTAPSGESPAASKTGVESLLANLLPMREQLEASAVERWAAADYARAKELERQGDAALVDGDYAEAQTRYGDALAIYESLAERRGSALAESLQAGAAALEAREPTRAVEAYALALAIAPEDEAARAGAQRAEGLGSVLLHMDAGQAFEADGSLDAARGEYAKVVEIDPEFAPAREALERTSAAQTQIDFDSNLSLGVVALTNGKFKDARAHFERAREIRPDSPEVADGLRQLQQTESARAIASLRTRAEAAEATENWGEAASLYQSIVDTQKNLPFAEQGLRRTRELARISERIENWLGDPTQLFQAEALDEARDLIALAQSHAAGKPKLSEQVQHLEIAVQLASTPIPVVFESDAVTEVVIRGMGTLGNFSRRDVPLKPGRYVVVGRRNGYRDTRSEISIVPGRPQPVVDVRCTEKI